MLPRRALSVAHAHIESALAVVSGALSLVLVSKRPPPPAPVLDRSSDAAACAAFGLSLAGVNTPKPSRLGR